MKSKVVVRPGEDMNWASDLSFNIKKPPSEKKIIFIILVSICITGIVLASQLI